MMAQQVQLDKELVQAQEDAACKERQRAKEAAAKEKKEREKREKRDAERRQEERELAAAKARVAKDEAEVKVRAEVGELAGGSNASSDNDIVIAGVDVKVSGSPIAVKQSD